MKIFTFLKISNKYIWRIKVYRSFYEKLWQATVEKPEESLLCMANGYAINLHVNFVISFQKSYFFRTIKVLKL